MKVFISSVIAGYEAYRAVVQTAVETLGHEVIRAEDFGASDLVASGCVPVGRAPGRPCHLAIGAALRCRPALRHCGNSRRIPGGPRPQGHHSLCRRRERPRASPGRFVKEVQAWEGGLFTKSFSDEESLRRGVTKALYDHMLAQARGAPDPHEIKQRAVSLLPENERGWSRSYPLLGIAVAGGPKQVLLRPVKIGAMTSMVASFSSR